MPANVLPEQCHRTGGGRLLLERKKTADVSKRAVTCAAGAGYFCKTREKGQGGGKENKKRTVSAGEAMQGHFTWQTARNALRTEAENRS